jgi:peptidoglycan-associated lipoprotein
MSRFSLLVVLAAVPVALAGCHHAPPAATVTQPTSPTTPSPTRSVNPPPPPAAAHTPAALTDDELFRRKSLADLNAEHPLADVFFAYNENTLTEAARTDLQRNAAWLKQWPQTRIAVDGHCDERGTAEYNLGLGDRRALVVRDYLNTLGVSADRIQTRSLGKEAPFCSGEGEGCWSQNRRDHFLITAK